jgi:hypothetical protein
VNIRIAVLSEADALTKVAFASKGHWGYPAHWMAQWKSILTMTPALIAAHETYVACDEERIIGFAVTAAVSASKTFLSFPGRWVAVSVVRYFGIRSGGRVRWDSPFSNWSRTRTPRDSTSAWAPSGLAQASLCSTTSHAGCPFSVAAPPMNPIVTT